MQCFGASNSLVPGRPFECEHKAQISKSGVAAQSRIKLARTARQRRYRGQLIVPQALTARDQQQRRCSSDHDQRDPQPWRVHRKACERRKPSQARCIERLQHVGQAEARDRRRHRNSDDRHQTELHQTREARQHHRDEARARCQHREPQAAPQHGVLLVAPQHAVLLVTPQHAVLLVAPQGRVVLALPLYLNVNRVVDRFANQRQAESQRNAVNGAEREHDRGKTCQSAGRRRQRSPQQEPRAAQHQQQQHADQYRRDQRQAPRIVLNCAA